MVCVFFKHFGTFIGGRTCRHHVIDQQDIFVEYFGPVLDFERSFKVLLPVQKAELLLMPSLLAFDKRGRVYRLVTQSSKLIRQKLGYLQELGVSAATGRVATGDWFAVKGARAAWIRDTFSPLLVEMEGGAIAQVCLRNNVRFVSVKSVSDHLFAENQAEEYFDFGQALEALGRAVLPLAMALKDISKEEL